MKRTLEGADHMLFGLAADFYGIAELRYIYTREQLMRFDSVFRNNPMGGYKAERSDGMAYIVSRPLKNLEAVREFLLNRNDNILMCNSDDPQTTDDANGKWQVSTGCFFAPGVINMTTVKVCAKLHIDPDLAYGDDPRIDGLDKPNELEEDDFASYMGAVYDTIEWACEKTEFGDMAVQVDDGLYPVKAKELLKSVKACKSPYSDIELDTMPDYMGRRLQGKIPFKTIDRILDVNGIVAYETDEAFMSRMMLMKNAGFHLVKG